MAETRWAAVDDYIGERLLPPDPVLDAALAANAAAGPAGDRRLAGRRASSCTSSPASSARGASSRSARSAATRRSGSPARCPTGGRLVTLEADPQHAEVARANIARAGLADRVEVRVGPALDDAAGPRRRRSTSSSSTPTSAVEPDYLDWALRLSRPGTVIVCDNVVRDGRVADAGSRRPRRRRHPRASSTWSAPSRG